MKKTIKGKCIICGEVEITHFEGGDGEVSIPTEICPTLKEIAIYYKEITGDTFEENTGNKLKDSFEKKMIQPSHKNPDDDGYEEYKKHTLEPIECWCEII